METLNALTQVLGNGFFPIAVCGVLFWYVNKKDAAHQAEMSEMRKSVEANTTAVLKLVDAVDDMTRRVTDGKNKEE